MRRGGLIVSNLAEFANKRVRADVHREGPAGAPYLIKVLGRDQRDENLFLRAWRAIRCAGWAIDDRSAPRPERPSTRR